MEVQCDVRLSPSSARSSTPMARRLPSAPPVTVTPPSGRCRCFSSPQADRSTDGQMQRDADACRHHQHRRSRLHLLCRRWRPFGFPSSQPLHCSRPSQPATQQQTRQWQRRRQMECTNPLIPRAASHRCSIGQHAESSAVTERRPLMSAAALQFHLTAAPPPARWGSEPHRADIVTH